MNFFRLHQPKGFQHTYLYYNERKEQLKKLQEAVLNEHNKKDNNAQKQMYTSIKPFFFKPHSIEKKQLFYGFNLSLATFFILLILLLSATLIYLF